MECKEIMYKFMQEEYDRERKRTNKEKKKMETTRVCNF
jgi:hypothetical protein